MPEMDGITAARQIRIFEEENNLKKVPIIALTASHTVEIEQKSKAVGMDDIISKPFKKNQLLKKISYYVK